jgi:hypothetical protein
MRVMGYDNGATDAMQKVRQYRVGKELKQGSEKTVEGKRAIRYPAVSSGIRADPNGWMDG